MNIKEALDILEAPEGSVDAGLRVEAERCLAQHPEAKAELDQRLQADFRIRAAFNSIAVPQGLHAACLATFSPQQVDAEETVVVASQRFFLRPWMLAAAAAIAIMLLVQMPLRDGGSSSSVASVSSGSVSHAGVGALLNDLGRQFGSFGSYHHQPDAVAEAASFFGEQNAPVSDFLTSQFSHVVPDGCRVLNVQGHLVSMVCLRTDPFMHLFVAPREVVGEIETSELLEKEAHSVSFVAWVDGEHLLILATRFGTCDDLKRFVASIN